MGVFCRAAVRWKAVEALHLVLKQEAWGQIIARLLKELPITVSEDIRDNFSGSSEFDFIYDTLSFISFIKIFEGCFRFIVQFDHQKVAHIYL